MKNILLLIIGLTLFTCIGYGQEKTERTIHIMRTKQFYGSGAKMDVRVNDNSVHKLKNGNRMILKASKTDTLRIQIVYPLAKKHQSELIVIVPDDDTDIYLNAFYWGEGYNPLKHAGVLRGSHGGGPEFNVEIERIEVEEEKLKFYDAKLFKDNLDIIPTILYNPE